MSEDTSSIQSMKAHIVSPNANITIPPHFLWTLQRCSRKSCKSFISPLPLEEDPCSFAGNRTFKKCTHCHAVCYCSKKCQQEDWWRHRARCGDIVKRREFVQKLKQQVDNWGVVEQVDPWNKDGDAYGDFASFVAPHFLYVGDRYLNARMDHAIACESAGDLGRAIAIECCLDILELEQKKLTPIVNIALVKVVSLLSEHMDQYSRAYGLLKAYARAGFWNFALTSERQLPGAAPAMHPYQIGDTISDLSESTAELDLTHNATNTSVLFLIFQLKFWLFENTRNLELFAHVLKNEDCVSKVGEFLGIPFQWRQGQDVQGAKTYLVQAKEILSASYGYDAPGLLMRAKACSNCKHSSPSSARSQKYFSFFVNNIKTELIDFPISRELEQKRLEKILDERMNLLPLSSTNLTACELRKTNVRSNLESHVTIQSQSKKEMLMAQSHFHLHKFSEPVRNLFAQMGKDSTKIRPRTFFILEYVRGEPVFRDVADIIKVLKRNKLCTAQNLDLCFGNKGHVALFGKKPRKRRL